MNKKAMNHGFTLIELMIVVAIIGIIAAVAYPSYQTSVKKSFRGEAKSHLMTLASDLERDFVLHDTYANFDPDNNKPTGQLAERYSFSFTQTPTAKTFTLQATPIDHQLGDPCGTLTLNQAGVTTPDDDACW